MRKKFKKTIVACVVILVALLPMSAYGKDLGTNVPKESNITEKNVAETIVTTMETTISKVEIEIERRKELEELERKKRELEQKMYEEQLEMLAHLIVGEAQNQDDDCQKAVGNVVLNRMKNKNYPDTMEKVIFQKGQYACIWDGNYDKTPSEKEYENARWLLEGNRILPDNVIYQAHFIQGSGLYKQIGTELFCYE